MTIPEMKQKLLQLLLNPYFIAGLITLAIIYFLPDYFSRYQVVLAETDMVADGQIVYHEDLDGDGKSEKIMAQERQDQFSYNASYLLYNSDGDFVDQFNLNKPFCNERKIIWFKDLNRDGIKEIYIPTKSNDSLFLNVQEHVSTSDLIQKEVFIDVVTPYNKTYEFNVHGPIPFSSLKHHNSELYISITNGFGGNPRNIYKYDYNKNEIVKSPHTTNPGGISDIIDLDNDNKNEILFDTNSAGNDIDTTYTKRSDYSLWLTVLDDDMDFLFDPLEFKCQGAINLIAVNVRDSIKLVGFIRSHQNKKLSSKLLRISNTGLIEIEQLFAGNAYQSQFLKFDGNYFGVYDRMTGRIFIYDFDLEKINDYNIQPKLLLYSFDIDADGENEWIGFNNYENRIYIFRSGFKDQVTLDGNNSVNSDAIYGLRQLSETRNLIYFQKNNKVSYYDYIKNPNYYYGYLAYLGIYGIVLGFLLLVVKGQKIIEAKKRATEAEIAELQLKTIKNQVDPHFVFNAINTISEMTLMDNKLEADKFISRFSGFMRDTLTHSDKISTTLKEELDYTENFIKLQQIRFNNSFDYQILVDNKVNKHTIVPKHVLFCYVENAIKHGLAMKKKGLIKIEAKSTTEALELTIEDNGTGIESNDKPKKNSTGSGLKIMDKIFELYTRLYKRKIRHRLIELTDSKNNKTGIRVEIKIYNSKKIKT